MSDNCCLQCAFYDPNREYECAMTEDIPVICSVKMKRMKQEKREAKYEIQ